MSISSLLGQLVEIFRGWTPPTPTPTPTPDPYVLPPATSDTLGGVKVGDGLSVQPDGTLSSTSSEPDYFILKEGPNGVGELVVDHAPCTVEEFVTAVRNGRVPWGIKIIFSANFQEVGDVEYVAYGCGICAGVFYAVTSEGVIGYPGCMFVFNTPNMNRFGNMCQYSAMLAESNGVLGGFYQEIGGDQ